MSERSEATTLVARAFAASRGGRCLSVEVESHRQKLRWECGRGHAFEASLSLTRHAGYWCPTCAPSVEDPSGWDYDEIIGSDPLLAQFHIKLKY